MSINLDAAALANLIRRRESSAEDIVGAYLARISALNGW